MICESVRLREVLPHIDATTTSETHTTVSAVVQRRRLLALDEPDTDADDPVFLLLTRRPPV